MVAVFIGNNIDGALQLFLAGKPVIFFQIQKQVVHVNVGQRGTGALPAQMCIRDRLDSVRVLETEKKNVRAVGIGGIFSVSNPANCHYLLL